MPTGLKGTALNRARTNINKLMQDSCAVWGTVGTPTRTRTQLHSNWPCQVGGLKPAEAAQLAREDGLPEDAYKIRLPWNTSLARDYEIVVNGYTYKVFDVIDDMTPLVYKLALVIRA